MISRTSTALGIAATGVLVAIACVHESNSQVEASSHAAAPAVDLVLSEPGAWADTLPPVLELGTDAVPQLIRVIERYPGAPGVQAAIGALGNVANGDERTRRLLLELARDPDRRVATEAALSIGRAGTEADLPAVRALIRDQSLPARVRAAATASAIDLGDLAFAVPFVRSITLAGTDREPERRRELGLPNQTRWAYERTMLFDAIARASEGERFGLDPDLSWPQMEAAIERFEVWAKEQRR